MHSHIQDHGSRQSNCAYLSHRPALIPFSTLLPTFSSFLSLINRDICPSYLFLQTGVKVFRRPNWMEIDQVHIGWLNRQDRGQIVSWLEMWRNDRSCASRYENDIISRWSGVSDNPKMQLMGLISTLDSNVKSKPGSKLSPNWQEWNFPSISWVWWTVYPEKQMPWWVTNFFLDSSLSSIFPIFLIMHSRLRR
jgi:hypothetical protein